MTINLVLIVFGVTLVIYGFQQKIKLWMGVGIAILCLTAVSIYIDLTVDGTSADAVVNSRVPAVVEQFSK